MGSRAAEENRVGPQAAPGAAEATAVELPLELQREIRDFGRTLPDADHYALLGVARDASRDAVQLAFFERSKRFHPDRYFRKKLGPFGLLLHEIYKRIALAHEVLRDEELRARYDASLARAAQAKQAAARPAAGAVAPGKGAPGSLRARAGVRPPNFALRALERQLALGASRASGIFTRAQELVARAQWTAAAAALRDAVALDPGDRRYQNALADVLPRANEVRAGELLEGAAALLAKGPHREALALLEQAAELRPTDARLAARIAALVLDLGAEPARAVTYAERAAQLEANEAWAHRALARAQRAAGQGEAARRALERALELDPKDEEARAELAAL